MIHFRRPSRLAYLGCVFALSAALGGLLGQVRAPVDLSPISPDDAVSPQHQVRQDMAITEVARLQAEHEAEDNRRLDRIERLDDAIVVALIAGIIAQAWTISKARGTGNAVRTFHQGLDGRLDELVAAARTIERERQDARDRHDWEDRVHRGHHGGHS